MQAMKEIQQQGRTQRDREPIRMADLRSKVQTVEQPAPVFKEIALNKRYSCERHGRKTYVYPVEVKKKEVLLKNNLEDKHSTYKSRAEFDKFFKLDEE